MLSFVRADRSDALYVPAATVCLGTTGQDLLHHHGLAVTQVEVDLQLSMASTFKLVIPNTFHAGRQEFLTAFGQPALDLLKLGTRVWIWMGYGDRKRQTLLLSGYITAVGTNFTEGASPDLEVSGQDSLYRLTLGTRDHRVESGSVRDAVTKVAKDNSFTPEFKEDPPVVKMLDANMQSDLDFLRKVVGDYSQPNKKWEFFSRPEESRDVLCFSPRSFSDPEVGVLKWGADLLSFKPEANLGNQISRVDVHGWDEIEKKPILGQARAQGGTEPDAKTGGEIQSQFLTREVARVLKLPVRSIQEANQRAAAELAKSIADHLKGDGEALGFPELVPGSRLRLDGLGAKFSRSFYVTKTTHRYDSSGYRTRFSIEEPDS